MAGSLTVVHATDGAPADGRDAAAHGFACPADYADARRAELLDALALAGVGPDRCRTLDLVDQTAALHLADLTRRVAGLIDDLRPAVVLTHAYEGGHPDHDAVAFAVAAAVRWLARGGADAPAVVEMAGYHAAPSGLSANTFLPGRPEPVVTVELTAAERDLKRRMLGRFTSQRDTLALFPPDVERFRPAPQYDFARPPHDGPPWYERHGWPMTGERFGDLARRATNDLHL